MRAWDRGEIICACEIYLFGHGEYINVASNPGLPRRFFRSHDKNRCHDCENICVEGLGSRLISVYVCVCVFGVKWGKGGRY